MEDPHYIIDEAVLIILTEQLRIGDENEAKLQKEQWRQWGRRAIGIVVNNWSKAVSYSSPHGYVADQMQQNLILQSRADSHNSHPGSVH